MINKESGKEHTSTLWAEAGVGKRASTLPNRGRSIFDAVDPHALVPTGQQVRALAVLHRSKSSKTTSHAHEIIEKKNLLKAELLSLVDS